MTARERREVRFYPPFFGLVLCAAVVLAGLIQGVPA